jgi:hypothetical protein
MIENFKDVKQWVVMAGRAAAVNPYHHNMDLEENERRKDFDQWAHNPANQPHTDAPDGGHEADAFGEVVWQLFRGGEWLFYQDNFHDARFLAHQVEPKTGIFLARFLAHQVEPKTRIFLPLIRVAKKKEPDLHQLQYNLRQLLYVRPFDINLIESAAIKLCDAVLEINP